MAYTAPLNDLLFALRCHAGLEVDDTIQAVLEECARLSEEVIAPLNAIGDQQPSTFTEGQVKTTPGFKAAYSQYIQGGWQGLSHDPEIGGQGLPKAVAAACGEIVNSANLSFALCPLLTDGAIEALKVAGSPSLQERYLPYLVSGQWAGTMNLTEPQAGSDLALVRTEARPDGEGTYRVFGNKIFITYGEHDLTENIVHLVLARIAGAPAGVKGLSLFVCPKFLSQSDGTLGQRNDVHCMRLEHKMGIKASPTAELRFGDQEGAWAEIVGEPGRGLEYMFIMMNAARFAVGVQGIAVSERAYQQARQYAQERVQSRPVDAAAGDFASRPIIQHPDVRRMLMTMRAATESARALAMYAAAAEPAVYEWLVPVIKAFATELSLEVTSLGVQVHGGAGYIEETGAAQHFRDGRILTIYEGTTAIQANDFLARKTLRDKGEFSRAMEQQVAATVRQLTSHAEQAVQRYGAQLERARQSWMQARDFMLMAPITHAYAGSVPYLMLSGYLLAGWQMGQALLQAASEPASEFTQSKRATVVFYGDHLLSRTLSLCEQITQGGASTMAII